MQQHFPNREQKGMSKETDELYLRILDCCNELQEECLLDHQANVGHATLFREEWADLFSEDQNKALRECYEAGIRVGENKGTIAACKLVQAHLEDWKSGGD